MQNPGAQSEMTGNPLISAGKVQGTAVYNIEGERLGHVDDLMLHKLSGKVAFAIMSFGGFLGVGEHFTPLPWAVLTYDTGKNGYVVPLSREQLQNAPHYNKDELTNDDTGWGARVNDYYPVTPSWA